MSVRSQNREAEETRGTRRTVRAHRLDDAVTAVDTNFGTGHEARRVAGKEDDGTSEVLRLAHL